ncbi:hypothetical protein AAL_00271 [Moelleriella libera RCEF 2490]|uniref:Fibroin-3 related protein n=1 Tax=Moelleriella libera RCEF 2490 TaxID=1081109 RepID=A0A162K3U0_9HYPO|nr:hypothetical protein AAL_00271 [Moelleriella libera RCEF 2490]
MPSIDVAMARSLRPGAWDALNVAVARGLSRRNVVGDAQGTVTDVKTAFSSWDNCMKASFCKWPVIAIIIVGGLIIFSILWCIIRCAFCGLSCCCTCFSCLKCCGNCCGCCDPPGRRNNKYLDEPFLPPNQGYRNEAPMQASFPPTASTRHAGPQYAMFDVPKKGGEDSLPQMPSWEQSGSQKVMMADEVEMSNLNKLPAADPTRRRVNSPSPGPVSPLSTASMEHGPRPYGGLPGSSSGQISNHSQQALLPNQQSMGYSQVRQSPYGARGPNNYSNSNNNINNGYQNYGPQQSDGFGLDEPYDVPSSVSAVPPPNYAMQNGSPYGAPGRQPYGNAPDQPYGAVGSTNGPSQPGSPHYGQPFGAPPPLFGAAVGPGNRPSPTPLQNRGHTPYSQEQVYTQYNEVSAETVARSGANTPIRPPPQRAEMPAFPLDSSRAQTPSQAQSQQHAEMPAYPVDGARVHTPIQGRQQRQHAEMSAFPLDHGRGPAQQQEFRDPSPPQNMPMELPGSEPPAGYGMKQPSASESSNMAPPMSNRSPARGDPRARNPSGPGSRSHSPYGRPPGSSNGPRQRSQSPYGRPPRSSPASRGDAGYGRPPPTPRGNGSRGYSPAPPRQYPPGPQPQFSQGMNRQQSPGPGLLARPMPPPAATDFGQSPPQSPITNNAGFDFTSGYSRPQGT